MLCVRSVASGKHSVYLASGRPRYEVASHNVSLFKAVPDSDVSDRRWQMEWGRAQVLVAEQAGRVLLHSPGPQPVPSPLSLHVRELQIDLMSQINLNCK